MNSLTKFRLVCLLTVVLGGCGKNRETEFAARDKVDACKLLTDQEIQTVQGSAITDKKGSGQGNGRVFNAQCYFAAEQSNRSVSLTVTQADPGSSNHGGARTFWEETFGRFENDGHEKESEAEREKKESLHKQKGEEDEEAKPPKKITGIGEEAFWSASSVSGALYVLKKDVYVRISLGGPDSEEVRIAKSKALAQKVLDRL